MAAAPQFELHGLLAALSATVRASVGAGNLGRPLSGAEIRAMLPVAASHLIVAVEQAAQLAEAKASVAQQQQGQQQQHQPPQPTLHCTALAAAQDSAVSGYKTSNGQNLRSESHLGVLENPTMEQFLAQRQQVPESSSVKRSGWSDEPAAAARPSEQQQRAARSGGSGTKWSSTTLADEYSTPLPTGLTMEQVEQAEAKAREILGSGGASGGSGGGGGGAYSNRDVRNRTSSGGAADNGGGGGGGGSADIYVKRLPEGTSESELQLEFGRFGTVVRVHLVEQKSKLENFRGPPDEYVESMIRFAFLRFESAAQANLALAGCRERALGERFSRCAASTPNGPVRWPGSALALKGDRAPQGGEDGRGSGRNLRDEPKPRAQSDSKASSKARGPPPGDPAKRDTRRDARGLETQTEKTARLLAAHGLTEADVRSASAAKASGSGPLGRAAGGAVTGGAAVGADS